jgi:hypothetical protein
MSITSNFPAIKPTLLLDFANTKQLDSRITFTRASTATYYGTQTAKAEENLLLQSQDFTTTWTTTGSTASANSVAAPDGTTTADTIAENTSTSGHILSQVFPIISGSMYSASVFGKNVDGRYVFITFRGAGSNYVYALFDLLNGVVTTSSATGTGYSVTSTAIQDVGNGWYRCSVVGVVGTTVSSPFMYVGLSDASAPTSSGFPSYTGTSKSIYIWGAQLEQRSAVTAYTPTTTQAITNYVPQLLTAASGVARFDHNPTTFESLGLEIEESRTNLVLQSQFASGWSATRSTLSTNQIIAPDGTLTGSWLFEDTTATNTHNVGQSVSFTSGTTYTVSVFAKATASPRFLQIIFPSGAFTATRRPVFDLLNGTALASTDTTASIQNIGNGWYRCVASMQATSTSSASAQLQLADTYTNGSPTYTGDGYSGLYIWGAQVEAGAFATSYIPTVASQVTRAAEVASMTGTNFSSWFNQQQGSLYVEATPVQTGTQYVAIIGDGVNSTLGIGFFTDVNQLSARVRGSGASSAIGGTLSITANTAFKAMLSYAAYNNAWAYNGANRATGNTNIKPENSATLQIGSGPTGSTNLTGTIKKLSFYPVKLTDAQMNALTI